MSKHKQKKSSTQQSKLKIPPLKNIRVCNDNILLKPIIFQDDGTGVVKPNDFEDKAEWGEVIAVGPGRITDTGTLVPILLTEGQKVLFQKYSAQKFRHSGVDYIIVREDDLYLVI